MSLLSAKVRLDNRKTLLGTTAKKSLGQNFLVSDHVISKILAAAETFQASRVLEIGPGLGALTDGLLLFKNNFEVIELDQAFADYWREQGLKVHECDALNWNWQAFADSGAPTLLVSNLPYQISSTLVIDRCLDAKPLLGMVLMFQKEVAQRIRARRGDDLYGFLSVIIQSFWKTEMLLEASSHDFSPPPKVASRVLVFRDYKSQVDDPEKYLKFLKGCFSHPRKLMVSNLAQAGLGSKEFWKNQLTQMGLGDKVRAEELGVGEFLELYKRTR